MKKIIIAVLASLASAQMWAGQLQWMTDFNKAQATAKAEKKMVFLNFTGSDWCGWCIKLNREVFSTPEFAEYAGKHLVLVEVDFPRRKQLSDEQVRANRALAATYRVKGYPTIIILNSDGRKIGELGYMRGGPKPFIAELEKIRKSS